MLPTLVQKPPSGDKWLHEIKHDGYRTQLALSAHEQLAFTRNGFDWSDCYSHILSDARRLNCAAAIMDGEVIVQDDQGRSNFDALPLAIEREPERLIFYAFDLLHIDGADLCAEPLIDRRSRLQELIGEHDPSSRIQFCEHVIGGGPEFCRHACEMELEGIVSKNVNSRYRSGRSKSWLKTKAFVESEFVVLGYQENRGTPPCALLAEEQDWGLDYAGSAFVTLSGHDRERFWRTMERLHCTAPAAEGLKARAAAWVRPELRVRVKHLRCSGKLRHATIKSVVTA